MAGDYLNWTTTWGDTAAGTTTDGMPYCVTPWYNADDPYTYQPTGTVTIKSADTEELKRKVEELEKRLGGEAKMRSLFKVYVVDPRKTGKLLAETTVIAETEEQAILKAGVAQIAEKAGLELEQIDTLVNNMGEFIRPRKETQRVKMVKDEED